MILLIDHDGTWTETTARQLRGAGYTCSCAHAATLAEASPAQIQGYDLVIVDTTLAGTTPLRLVAGLPVIVVMEIPSLDTALAALHLPALACLVKPVDDETLLAHVRRGMEYARLRRMASEARQKMAAAVQELDQLMKCLATTPLDIKELAALLVSITMQSITSGVLDLQQLAANRPGGTGPVELEGLVQTQQRALLLEAVHVLEKTKSAFRSKDLGALRKKLQGFLKNH